MMRRSRRRCGGAQSVLPPCLALACRPDSGAAPSIPSAPPGHRIQASFHEPAGGRRGAHEEEGDGTEARGLVECGGAPWREGPKGGRHLKYRPGGRDLKYRPPLGTCQPSDGHRAAKIGAPRTRKASSSHRVRRAAAGGRGPGPLAVAQEVRRQTVARGAASRVLGSAMPARASGEGCAAGLAVPPR